MRVIKTFATKQEAKRYSDFLTKSDIENTVDLDKNEVWVKEEEVEKANSMLKEFESKKHEKKIFHREKTFTITLFFLFTCIAVYLFNFYQENIIKKSHSNLKYVLLTPIQKSLLYDVPHVLIEVDKIIKKYNINPTKDIKKQSFQAYEELQQIDKKPFYRGIYEMVVTKDYTYDKSTLFEKIKKGQIWRIFTPCVLHKDLLHILFNMLWLWLLGRQVEARLSKFKYLLLIVIIGVVSNTCQYIMSGPYFLGYSGIITGMVGFIWARQKEAPWEGYPLQKAVFLFLGIYVLLMFVLSFFSFVTQIIGLNLFTPNIANTAHIIGAISGYLLGRISFFSWSPVHES